MNTTTILLFHILISILVSSLSAAAIPQVTVAGKPTKLRSLNAQFTLTGHWLTRSYEMTFYTEDKHMSEGELIFPLQPDQHIISYAMDVNGVKRDGVLAPREKAKFAYETIVSQKIDPGILEIDRENGTFKTRVYPLVNKSPKTVWITTLELIPAGDIELLPAGLGTVENWQVLLSLQGGQASTDLSQWAVSDASTFSLVGKNSEVPKMKITWSPDDNCIYEYDDHLLSVTAPAQNSLIVKEIDLIYDASLEYQDIALNNLAAFLKKSQTQTVRLISCGERMTQVGTFQLKHNAFADLEKHLRDHEAASWAQFDRIVLPKGDSPIALLTDGASPYGKDYLNTFCESIRPPLHIIDTGAGTSRWLRPVAVESGGGWHHKGTLDPFASADEKSLVSIQADHLLTFLEEIPDGSTRIKTKAAQWAAAYFQYEVMSREGASQADIIRHQQKHGIMADTLSWLVLESARDYSRYGITPPTGEERLIAEWQILEDKKSKQTENKLTRLAAHWSSYCDDLSKERMPLQLKMKESLRKQISRLVKASADVSAQDIEPLKNSLTFFNNLPRNHLTQKQKVAALTHFRDSSKIEKDIWKKLPRIQVQVGGEVHNSRSFSLPKGSTLKDAVTQAGGANPFGSIRRVKLMRDGKQTTYDLRDNLNQNTLLKDRDVILVPQKNVMGCAPSRIKEFNRPDPIKIENWDESRPYLKLIKSAITNEEDWESVFQANEDLYGQKPTFYKDVIDLLRYYSRLKDAKLITQQMARRFLHDPEVVQSAALYLLILNAHSEAFVLLTHMRHFNPESFDAQFQYATLASQMNKIEQATRAFETAFKLSLKSRSSLRILVLEEFNAHIHRHGLVENDFSLPPEFIRFVQTDFRIISHSSNFDPPVFNLQRSNFKILPPNRLNSFGSRHFTVVQALPDTYKILYKQRPTNRPRVFEFIKYPGQKHETRTFLSSDVFNSQAGTPLSFHFLPSDWVGK